jgi:hypothetical protein
MYANVTNLERPGYRLVPAVVEKHGTHAVFINIKHPFIPPSENGFITDTTTRSQPAEKTFKTDTQEKGGEASRLGPLPIDRGTIEERIAEFKPASTAKVWQAWLK